MIIWLLLSLNLVWAHEPVIEEYCYSSSSQMKASSKRLKFILLPVDKIEENDDCLTVSTPSHRRELLQNYARKLDPSVQVRFSSVESKRDPCNIKVEKVKSAQSQSISGSVNTQLIAHASGEKSDQNMTEVMSIRTDKDFELTVNQDSITGSCKAINADRYSIELVVKKVAEPLYPGLPPNSVVVVSGAQLPPDQETSHLATTLQLNRGEKIEIGSIIKDLKKTTKNADIISKGRIETTVGAATEKVFLTID